MSQFYNVKPSDRSTAPALLFANCNFLTNSTKEDSLDEGERNKTKDPEKQFSTEFIAKNGKETKRKFMKESGQNLID